MIRREDYQNLDAPEQEKVFRQSPLAEKAELIILAHHPEKLTRSLSDEELYLVTRHQDTEETGEILKYAAPRQLAFIADMECWNKDRMDRQGFLHWIEILEAAGDPQLLFWLLETDYETVVSGLKYLVWVLKPEWEYAVDEVLEDRPYFTLDQQYYIYVDEENMQTVRRALEILFENHRGRYTAILEGILGEVDDMIEEEAFSNRERRLSDRGFPSTESANRIYRPISEKELKEFPKKSPKEHHEQKISFGDLKMPDYPALWKNRRLFIDAVIAVMQAKAPGILEEVREELAWLSNKVIAAEGMGLSSEEVFKKGIERVHSIVSLGLEILSGEDTSRAAQIAADNWIEIIFRRAMTECMKLRDGISGILRRYWDGRSDSFFHFLGDPYEPLCRAAFMRIPQFYDADAKDDLKLRDFRSREELQSTAGAVLQVERMHAILEERFPKSFLSFCKKFKDPDTESGLTALLATVYAHYAISKRLSLADLKPEQVRLFLQKGMKNKNGRFLIDSSIKESFLDVFLTQEDRILLAPLFGVVFGEIEDELGRLDVSQKRFDLRFIKCLNVKKLLP